MGSLVIWVMNICWLASGPGGEGFQWNLLTVQFPGYIFYHSFSKYDNPIYLYSPHIYLRVGDIERACPTKSVVPNALIQSDSNTFPADTRGIFLTLVLYYWT